MTFAHLDPGLAAYLRTNRDFVAAAVDEAVASLELREGGRVLDAGTGAGGALPPLAHAVGMAGTVLAVDLNPAVVALAAEHAAQAGIADWTTVRDGNVADVLAYAAAAPDKAFDAIWAADVVWPGNFDDPADIVGQMALALRPGGIVALFYSNHYQSTFLPGHSRLERALRTASELRWGLPTSGPRHYERHLAWLLAAGLDRVTLKASRGSAFPPTTTRPCALTSSPPCGQSCGSRLPRMAPTPGSRRRIWTRCTNSSPRATPATSWTNRGTSSCTRRSWRPATGALA